MVSTPGKVAVDSVGRVNAFLLGTVVVALLAPLVTRGSYRSLLGHRWYWGSFLLVAAGLQAGIEFIPAPDSGTHQIGFGLLVGSYVLLLAFVLRNAVTRGMSIVAIGIACNVVAIVVNEGMPVDVPPKWEATGGIEDTVKRHAQTADDRLVVLGDTILLPVGDEIISFGDLILAFALVDVSFRASRRSRRRSRTGAKPTHRDLAADQVDADEIDLRTAEIVEVPDSVGVAAEAWLQLDGDTLTPRPPSPIVSEVIEELAALRRAARGRHPTASVERREPFVGAASVGGRDDALQRLEHAAVVDIAGARVERFERERRA